MTVDDSGPTLLQSRPGHGYPIRSGSTEDPEFSPSKNSAEEDDIEFARQMQAATLLSEQDVRKLPSVVKWEGGGHSVFVSFDEGITKIPMVKSSSNFYTILDLPEGTHKYKFQVDGQWKCDPKEPKVGEGSSQFNVVNVKGSDFEVFEALAVDSIGTESAKYGISGSPPGSYSQIIPQKYNNPVPSSPPTLPPQLLQVILNTETPLQCEPTVLPEPNHVMLNHLYALSIKEGVMVMSGTHRYRKKYVTTLLYKPT
jgi:5'-AMP-activated protein kinase regulatory beta subunit